MIAVQAMQPSRTINGRTRRPTGKAGRRPHRAASAKALLGSFVKPERISAEGRADTEPLADNASAAGRAKNRRVEVTLFATAP